MRSVLFVVALAGCQAATPAPGTFIPADTQRPGDPNAGYAALVNNGYVSCGIPWSIYSRFSSFLNGPGPVEKLPGRTGKNADLPYFLTATTTARGIDVVAANCLTCHAGHINGQLVVGLGAADHDFTQDPSADATFAASIQGTANEMFEIQKWAGRVKATGPFITTLTVGVNPADNLAAVLFAHRDPTTLAWSDAPLMEPPPMQPLPVDVPPWWRMSKKHAMFYQAGGRGDHARIMMTASTLCTDSVAEAQAIDAYFPDVRAYIYSLTPPAWPFALDTQLAAHGKDVFVSACSSCHGNYGAGAAYPNLIVDAARVGTDPALATGAQFTQRFVDWFNHSFYGQVARLAPAQGYVAPPLDGIWATAPYLHNGSVPTLAALLDSRSRPRYFTRTYSSTDYDPAQVGWRFTPLTQGQDAEPDAKKRARIYDTTQPGYGNDGHTFGDSLSDADRLALLEYLKTL